MVTGHVQDIKSFNATTVSYRFAWAKPVRERILLISIHRRTILLRVVNHGIFGGYAIGVLGLRERALTVWPRPLSRQLLRCLMEIRFSVYSTNRYGYVAFLWSDRPDRGNAVFVEVSIEQFDRMSRLGDRN